MSNSGTFTIDPEAVRVRSREAWGKLIAATEEFATAMKGTERMLAQEQSRRDLERKRKELRRR